MNKIILIGICILLIGCANTELLNLKCLELKQATHKSIYQYDEMIELEERMKAYNISSIGINWTADMERDIIVYNKLCADITGEILKRERSGKV